MVILCYTIILGMYFLKSKIEKYIIIKMNIRYITDYHYDFLCEIKDKITKLIRKYDVIEKKDNILDKKINYSELLHRAFGSDVGNTEILLLYYDKYNIESIVNKNINKLFEKKMV